MVKDLQNRVSKVLELEMELDEVKDAYRQLEQSLSRDEQQYKQKAQRLERSLEQMSMMYQQAINDKSQIKVDLQISENKVKKKDLKLEELEKQLLISREKQKTFQSIIATLREEFIKVSQDATRLTTDQQKQ
jgi:kinesin family protein 5